MSDIAYRPLSQAEQIFKNIIWTPMIKAGETWLETEVPFLAFPVVKELDEIAIQAITDWTFSQIVLIVDIAAIRLVNTAHQAAYDAASEKLVVVAQEKGIGSDEYKAAQSQALSDLARFTHIGP